MARKSVFSINVILTGMMEMELAYTLLKIDIFLISFHILHEFWDRIMNVIWIWKVNEIFNNILVLPSRPNWINNVITYSYHNGINVDCTSSSKISRISSKNCLQGIVFSANIYDLYPTYYVVVNWDIVTYHNVWWLKIKDEDKCHQLSY